MPDSTALLTLLAGVTIKAAALVAVGLLADRALGRANAASRHLLWTAVMSGVLVLILTAPLPPAWSLPARVSIAIPRSAWPDAAPLAQRTDPSSPTTLAPAAEVGNAALQRMPGLADLIILLWLSAAAVLALRVLGGRVALHRIGVRGRPPRSGRADAVLRALRAELRLHRRVRLIESDALEMPATWGGLRPVIALPPTAIDWSVERLVAVLRHELAHVQRYDSLTQLVADGCCALLWFHPAVWFAARRMRIEREHVCDDAVLLAGTPDVGYADFLLSLAASGRRRTRAALAMADARDLERRLNAILNPALARSSSRGLMIAVPALALVGTLAIAGLDLWRTASLHASVVTNAQAHTPDDTLAVLVAERVPLTADDERRALARQFDPRDPGEVQAFARLRAATQHRQQHAADLIRERALWALLIAADDQVIAPVTAHLSDPDWRVRAYAAWTLGLIGPAGARLPLTAALRDPVWRVRSEAAATLAALADPRSTNDMLLLLADSAWQVRAAAAEFLGHIDTPAARTALRAHLNDPHVAVRTAAETALSAPASQ